MESGSQSNPNAPRIAIINANLNPQSKTVILLRKFTEEIELQGGKPFWIGLDQETLPFCDGYHCYQNKRVQELNTELADCDALVVGSPVYNYDLNAVAKNFLELTGQGWKHKPVTFVLTAGGSGSYMSPTSFANSLWLDHHCHLYPHFVYGLSQDFDGTQIVSTDLQQRIRKLAKGFTRFSALIRAHAPIHPDSL